MQTVETSAIRLHYKTFRFLFQLLNFFGVLFLFFSFVFFWGDGGWGKVTLSDIPFPLSVT